MPATVMLILSMLAPQSGLESKDRPMRFEETYKIESREDGLRLRFQPQFSIVKTKKGEIKLSFSGASDLAENAHGLEVPSVYFIIGVPENSRPTISNININNGRFIKGRLPSLPNQRVEENGVSYTIHETNTSRPSNDPMPVVARLIDRDYFRQQRIYGVEIVPYKIVEGGVQLLDDVTIDISFGVTAGRRTTPSLSAAEQALYGAAIDNFSSSVNWLRPYKRPERLGKRSVIEAGDWYQMSITEDGIYRIRPTTLSDAGVDFSDTRFNKIKVYMPYFGGKPINSLPGSEIPANLVETAIWRKDNNSNGIFDGTDELIFYGTGSSGFEYNPDSGEMKYIQNPYSDESIFWLNLAPESSAPGAEMTSTASADGSPTMTMTEYTAYFRYEEDIYNFLLSGLNWYGVIFQGTSDSREVPFNFQNIVEGSPVTVSASVKGGNDKAKYRHDFTFYLNDNYLFRLNNVTGYGRLTRTITTSQSGIRDGSNTMKISYTGSEAASVAYLDWVEFEYISKLRAFADRLHFYGPDDDGTIQYDADGFTDNDAIIFDITDQANPSMIVPSSRGGGRLTWKSESTTGSRKEFLALSPSNYLAVGEINAVDDFGTPKARITDTRAEYVIITHPDFRGAADRLERHRNSEAPANNRLMTRVAEIQDIYNEFSGGQTDPNAIRLFLQYAYENWGAPKLQYVLLMGDGDFDYRNITGNAVNFVPTFQIDGEGSLDNHIYSRTSDDFFVLLSGSGTVPDLVIGRINARKPEEADAYVDKLIIYETEPIFGQWRNTITVMADDLFRPNEYPQWIHIKDTEEKVIQNIPKTMNVKKIYLTEYPDDYDEAVFGVRKPTATEALLEQINRGTSMLTYIGHGGPTVLAQERVISAERDLGKIDTGMKLPIWVAATCEFGRFDNPNVQSMSEELVLLEERGAIAVISASRLSYASPNASYTGRFLSDLFPSNPYPSNSPRIAEAMFSAKLSNPSNSQKYHFFGDPTVRPVFPRGRASLQSLSPSVLQALGQGEFSGEVLDEDGIPISTSTAVVEVSVFDSEQRITRTEEYNGREGSVNFTKLGSRIFNGPVSTRSGNFNGSFIVPRDISYGGSSGRLLIYWYDEATGMDGAGYHYDITYSGTAEAEADNEGPKIDIGFKNAYFRTGDIVPQDAVLNVELTDEHGINLAEEVGHKITMVIDGKETDQYNLTPLFRYDVDSYKSGTLEFSMPELEPGEHSLMVKAWDNYNNFSIEEVQFSTVTSEKLYLDRVYNFPNPMSRSTHFTFYTNKPLEEIEVRIYTVAGRLIRKISELSAGKIGFQRVYWDGTDEVGDRVANGVYIYKLRARDYDSGGWTEHIEKLAIAR